MFFTWYNDEHHHTNLGLLTPMGVHAQADLVLQKRRAVLERAYQVHPERFVRGVPIPKALPPAVWINPPKTAQEVPAPVQ